jgi:hypothetical protein
MAIPEYLETCPVCGSKNIYFEEAWRGDVETEKSAFTGDIVVTYNCGAIYRVTEFNQTMWYKECPTA